MSEQLRLYRCHKLVRAAKIEAVHLEPSTLGFALKLEGGQRAILNPGRVPAGTPTIGIVGGYFVRYEDGYESFSPAATFEDGYTRLIETPTGLCFGDALAMLKAGRKVKRSGWNGKGLWLELQVPDAHSKMTLPYIFISYPNDAQNTPGARVPWLASQTDMLASDWAVVE